MKLCCGKKRKERRSTNQTFVQVNPSTIQQYLCIPFLVFTWPYSTHKSQALVLKCQWNQSHFKVTLKSVIWNCRFIHHSSLLDALFISKYAIVACHPHPLLSFLKCQSFYIFAFQKMSCEQQGQQHSRKDQRHIQLMGTFTVTLARIRTIFIKGQKPSGSQILNNCKQIKVGSLFIMMGLLPLSELHAIALSQQN